MAKFNNTNPLKFNPNTPIEIHYQKVEYIPGQGNKNTWAKLDKDGHSVFYGQWQTTYGDRAIAAEGLGVKESASFKTFYNPHIVEVVGRERCLVVKNLDGSAFKNGKPDKANPNLFEVWGGVDNVLEENQFLEFRVRRYEGN